VMGVSGPKIIELNAEVVEITESRMTVRIADKYVIFLEKSAGKVQFTVYGKKGDSVEMLYVGVLDDPTGINDYNIDEELKNAIEYHVSNWKYLLQKSKAEILLNARVKVLPNTATDKERLAMELARMIIEDSDVAYLKIDMNGRLSDLGVFCYENGAWGRCEEKIRARLKEYLHKLQIYRVTKNVVDEIINNKIELLASRIIKPDFAPRIAFENGIFEWEVFIETGDIERSLRPFDKDLWVFHKIPHTLNLDLLREIRRGLEKSIGTNFPPSTPKGIVDLLKQLSPKGYELLKSWAWYPNIADSLLTSRIAFLLEMVGRALFPGYRLFNTVVFKDLFVLLGETDRGKSTFLVDFLGDTVLGVQNYKVTRMRYLGSDDEDTLWKTMDQLYNVLAVLLPDIGKKDKISDWSVIRSISGGDPVTARKLYKQPYEYFPAYKIYISSNDPPKIDETGEAKKALLNRFKVIEFKNQFKKGSLNLKSYLNESDVEAIIICSIYALRLVYRRGEYSYTGIDDIEDALNAYIYPEYKVVKELINQGVLVFKEGYEITSDDLYRLVYEHYGKKSKEEEGEEEEIHPLPDQSTFTKNLKRLLMKQGVTTKNHSGKTVFKGIGLARVGLGGIDQN